VNSERILVYCNQIRFDMDKRMHLITYPSGTVGPLPPAPPKRYTVAEYQHLIEIGAFADNERNELIEGWLIPKMSRIPRHDVALDKSQDAIRPLLPSGWRLRIQSAITTSDSEPEPDLAIVPGPPDRYVHSHPVPSEIAALIEVSDASLTFDRNTKGRVYARANIEVYWIVNLIDRQVEVYTKPDSTAVEPSYASRQDYSENESVPLVIAGQQMVLVPVRSLLPN
jgi:hypothetical protein